MFRMLLFFVKLSLLVFAVVWAVENQGVMFVEWRGYIIEANTSIAMFIMLIVLFIFGALYHLWRRFISIPKVARDYNKERKRTKGYDAITKGFLALAIGDPSSSDKYAKKAEKLLPKTTLSLLLKAQSANLNGDTVTTREIFMQLLESKDGAFFGIRGLLSQALKVGNSEEALSLSRKAYKLEPKRPWVVFLLLELEIFKRNWKQAHELLSKAYKVGVFDKENCQQWRSALYLAQYEIALSKKIGAEQKLYAEKAFDACPSFAPAALSYSNALVHFANKKKALKILQKSWKISAHPQVLQEYIRLQSSKITVDIINSFTKHHQQNTERLIMLGEVALKNNLWGMARSFLTSSIERGADVRAYYLMAQLEEKTGGDVSAVREWEERAFKAPEEAQWVCGVSGASFSSWRAYNPQNGAFNTLVWGDASVYSQEKISHIRGNYHPPRFLIDENL